jgi:hypothetical protein
MLRDVVEPILHAINPEEADTRVEGAVLGISLRSRGLKVAFDSLTGT